MKLDEYMFFLKLNIGILPDLSQFENIQPNIFFFSKHSQLFSLEINDK